MLKEERGQILPYMAFTIMIMLIIVSYALSTSVMFIERKKVEDALDAALLSASFASIEEKKVATYYRDGLDKTCTKWETYYYDYTDDDGNVVEDSYDVCVDWYYDVVESKSHYKNYIYVKSSYKNVARSYFNLNLEANSKEAVLSGLDIKITYDNERFLIVNKKLKWLDPPSTYSDGKPIYGQSNNPDWWFKDFEESTDFLNLPEPFNITEEEEERTVRFPRWVKIEAEANVSVPAPLSPLIGGTGTRNIKLNSKIVRELLAPDRPSKHNKWWDFDDD